jgi:hypothetical protein
MTTTREELFLRVREIRNKLKLPRTKLKGVAMNGAPNMV